MNREETLFLLGGHDLEMEVIAELLKEHHYYFLDHQLSWEHALLSSYRGKWEDRETTYGIELYEDIRPGPGYIRIDHHNDFSVRPSSLEQVAEILGVKLNRYQQLVAVNDAAYIPGMLRLGASQCEISTIRRADRQAQGVTDEDERCAERAIRENLVKAGDWTIVKAFSSHFSPVCDRLFPWRRLIVYGGKELVCYGVPVEKLVAGISIESKEGKIFYGGGDNGYWGIEFSGLVSEEEYMIFIERIKQIIL